MNGLHLTAHETKACRAPERISKGTYTLPVRSFLGMAGIVAERNSVVLIGSVLAPEPLDTAHRFSVPTQIEELIQ
jgi:hypothetical protein